MHRRSIQGGLAVCLAAAAAGCVPPQSGFGCHRAPTALDAVVAGLSLLAAVAEVASDERPAPPSVIYDVPPPPPPRIVRTGDVVGRVVTAEAPHGVVPATVVTLWRDGSVWARARTEADGVFVISTPMPPGRYYAEVRDRELEGGAAFTYNREPPRDVIIRVRER